MLFIGDEIIFDDDLNKLQLLKNIPAKYVLQFFWKSWEFKNFFDLKKLEFDYKILISSDTQLRNFLSFFQNCPLVENEYLLIRRNGINLKDTYKVISEFESSLTDKIYVEQLDKNEWVSFNDFEYINKFLTDFDDLLPDNPTDMDIIINAYDYVKDRVYTREVDDKSLLSKQFSTSILTPYIVCSGFVKQFNGILKEYGIQCFEYKFVENEKEGHMVSLVNIKGLGIYFFDITRDCYTYEDENIPLKNESKYSGFMLPLSYYTNSNILVDNFDKEIYRNPKGLVLKEKCAIQRINTEKDVEVNFIDKQDDKLLEKLSTLMDTNFELLKDENFFDTVSDSKEQMSSKIYNALSIIATSFGSEFINVELFIDWLISAKRNSKFKNNTLFFQKAVISKFLGNNQVDLGNAMTLIKKKVN